MAFGDGPRSFEQLSSDRTTPELVPSLSFHTTPTGGRLSHDIFNVHSARGLPWPPKNNGSAAYEGCIRIIGANFRGGRGHHIIQICTATHGQKHLRSVLGGIVQNSTGVSKPALPQSFEWSSPAEEYGTFYEHKAGRYAHDLWID
ncbi:hypothetical protein TNCV_796501 [Trichonephila clavipes]|uniref:Uncharacterized protein n=1 Tax=Trichonephila clavipes TaxID=2585209 RepID=A0A8X6WJ86_TRICX|nr:hypothetical protein TNCV_796501 [Trichonephila clavipes]